MLLLLPEPGMRDCTSFLSFVLTPLLELLELLEELFALNAV